MTLARTRRLNPTVAAGYLAPYDSWQRRAAVRQFVEDIPASPRHPTWQTIESIENGLPALAALPALLVWGMRDWCFTPECLDRFAAAWSDAEVHRLADVGHWVLEDSPDDAQQRVEAFLRRTNAHVRL
jgi:cis-3-alkyl-4-acyloxetan-2-one decarboxylase